MRRHLGVIVGAVVASLALTGCSSSSSETSTAVGEPAAAGLDEEFCESMEHLITLLAPSESTSPSETEATFTEAAGWIEQARRSAPPSIADDVDTYALAYDEYIRYLGVVGYDLDVVFSTDEGSDLAIATSHTMTVPIVDYATIECGLSFGVEG